MTANAARRPGARAAFAPYSAGRRTNNLAAYDLFVRGRALVTLSAASNKAAPAVLEESIALDPGFSEAQAWLAMSHPFAWASLPIGDCGWWVRQDSNLQPDGYEPSALTIELRTPLEWRLRRRPPTGKRLAQRKGAPARLIDRRHMDRHRGGCKNRANAAFVVQGRPQRTNARMRCEGFLGFF